MPESLQPSKSILLLGASGKIGLEIRKALHAQATGIPVICCSRQPWEGGTFPEEHWLVFDPFSSKWEFPAPIGVVINAVGAIRETREMSFDKVHIGLTKLILAQHEAMGRPRIVQVSALGADPMQETAFLRSKGHADALLQDLPNAVVLRPSIVCTPDTMLSQKLRSLLKMARFSFGKLLVPSGFPATEIQPIMGADVGQAVAMAALHPHHSGSIDLVGPERIAFGALLQGMAGAQGRDLRLVEVSREIMETFVKHFVAVWFPDLINYDQFKLLFQDNVGDMSQTADLLQRDPISTMAFWEAEALGNAMPVDADVFPLIHNIPVAQTEISSSK